MKTCEQCGNEFEQSEKICPFCGAFSKPIVNISDRSVKLKTFNLKLDMPTVEQAITSLKSEIWKAKREKVKLLKIIHGYGSSGTGGEIRQAIHKLLPNLVWYKQIAFFIPGEEFSREFENGKKLLDRFPKMKKDSDYNRKNKGITIIVL
ncbi:MAG TPA: hypothetical protein ENL20_00520 [Candidatus Cloacimonetes bacterium]|nr:hypothetical protein [Candidatus Cloacimonadota bacterium]